MSDSSPHNVAYADVPDSPVQMVVYEGVLPPGEVVNVTPQRKLRQVYKEQEPKRKRRRTNTSSLPNVIALDTVVQQPSQETVDPFETDDQVVPQNCWPSDEIPMLRTSAMPPTPEPLKDHGYSSFVDAVLSDECSFYRLSLKIFVVNGWNEKKNEPLMKWFHLQRNGLEESGILCLCPDGRDRLTWCFHVRFMKEYGSQHFPSDEKMSGCDNETFLFSRSEHWDMDGHFINLFSVVSRGAYMTIKNRVVVEHVGNNSGSGTWTCHKNASSQECAHIAEA